MAILYKKVVRLSDPTNKTSAKKTYPVVTYKYSTPSKLSEFAKEISETAGLTEGDVYSVLKNFRKLLRKILMSGLFVNIEGLGCFYLPLQSKGTEKPEEFAVSDIEGLRVCFRANNDIRLHAGMSSTRSSGLTFKDVERIYNETTGSDPVEPEIPDDPDDEEPIDPMA